MRVESLIENLLFSTVRIEAHGETGTSAGTGFLFLYDVDPARNELYLVTNKHVVQNFQRVSMFFTRAKEGMPQVGERVDVQLEDLESEWQGHPDPNVDIAILNVSGLAPKLDAAGQPVFIRAVTPDLIPNGDVLNELDALEEVVFIGYPNGLYDNANLLPIIRKGITATPVQADHNGEPTFLVDASVFPGSSGSPVFIYNSGGYGSRTSFVVGDRLLFLGVIASVAIAQNESMIEFRDIPTTVRPYVTMRELLDLGIVFKARTVIETIERSLLADQNQVRDSRRPLRTYETFGKPRNTADAASPGDSSTSSE